MAKYSYAVVIFFSPANSFVQFLCKKPSKIIYIKLFSFIIYYGIMLFSWTLIILMLIDFQRFGMAVWSSNPACPTIF